MPMPGLVMAFKKYNVRDGVYRSPWVGLHNFEYLFTTNEAWVITRNTILYNLVFIVLGTVCDVGVAVILNDIVSKRKKKTYQTILLLPYMISIVVVAYLVNGFLASDTGFINNYIMEPLGLAPISFYAETKYWPFILTFINLWKGVGYSCIIYLANIGGIDPGYYEAASLDGAARWQRFLHITLPCLKPTIITLTILSIGKMFYSDFGLFYQVPMQSGTLFPVTQTIDTYVFYGLMNNGNIGMSAAAGLYQSVVGFVLVLATNAAVNKTILILMCIACLAPFLLLIASSFTSETALIANGYSFWPQELSLKAYQYLLQDSSVFRAYGVTLLLTAVGTTLSILVTTMIAYPLSMSSLPGRGMISFYVFFTMLFAGGLVPAYMMWTQTFHIKNTFLALLLPNLVTNGFIIMIMRSYFQANIPKEVLESARMDGARETFILFRIVIPMSLPIMATIGLMSGISYWNDHWRSERLSAPKKRRKNMDVLERVEELLGKMTLKEKIGQLNQAGSTMSCALPGFEADIDTWVSEMLQGKLSKEELDRRLVMCEENLREAYTGGVNWTFGPMLDIARDSRWGRIVESPGEDTYLACRIAKTQEEEFQRQEEEFQRQEEDGCRLMASAKHFAAYGAVSGGQDYNTVDLSERQLFEVHLPPFQAAIDAGAGAVMSAFHDLNGVPCTMDPWLLTDILRKRMGFGGFVVSDAEAVKQCVFHDCARDEKEAEKLSFFGRKGHGYVVPCPSSVHGGAGTGGGD
ncbi:MAG: ABC transporter permease subunit [Lachnospiraceae bacterium]|nr:ABC transporter permease subunit [Lachnospiraceae bacterium]